MIYYNLNQVAKADSSTETLVVRSGSIIYGDVVAGAHFQSGHNVMVRDRPLTVLWSH